MRTKRRAALAALVLVACGIARAQTKLDLTSQSRNPQPAPVRSGTLLPAVCAAGDLYFKLDAPAGTNLYLCSTANNWTPSGGVVYENSRTTFTSQTVVAVVHNRNTRAVITACFDEAGERVEPDRTVAPDVSSVITYFSNPQSGYCVVNTHGGSSGAGGGSGGSVASVFGRAGAVIAQAGDYSFGQLGGIASVAQGGTGATSAAGARQNLLPSLTGNDGKCLQVNSGAIDAGWGACVSGAVARPNAATTYDNGQKQTFQASGTTAGARVIPAALPSLGVPGDIAIDSADANKLKWFDGTAWQPAGSGAVGGLSSGTGVRIEGSQVSVDPATVLTYIGGTGSLSFSSFSGLGGCEEQAMALPGAVAGDTLTLGLPNSFPMGIGVEAVYVGAANTVVIRLCRRAGTATITSMPFNVRILKTF